MEFFKRKKFEFKKFISNAKNFGQFEIAAFEELVQYYEKNSNSIVQKSFGLKLIVISDTHGDLAFDNRFAKFMDQIPEYDLVIILGDIHCYELDKIVDIVPNEKIIALRGNHDKFEIYDKYNIRNINGQIYEYNGIKFAGIEGSFKYKHGEFPSYTHYESLVLASAIPRDAEILITHDSMFKENKYDVAHMGLAGITYYLLENKVQWHIHGHIHKSYQNQYVNGTREKSVYGCEYIEI